MTKDEHNPVNGGELPIRNSTAEFLVFAKDNQADVIFVRFQDKMLWLTLQLIAELFDVTKSTVSEHLANIYSSAELDKAATVRKFRTVRQEGSRQVERQLEYYSLEAIIAVGYRVNSSRATQFRRKSPRRTPSTNTKSFGYGKSWNTRAISIANSIGWRSRRAKIPITTRPKSNSQCNQEELL